MIEHLTPEEQGWYDRCEASVEDWPSDDGDFVEFTAKTLQSLSEARGLLRRVIGDEPDVFSGMVEWVDDTYKGHESCCGHLPDEDHVEDCVAVAIRVFLQGVK